MSKNYSLLFYLKKPKNYTSGSKQCDPIKWNSRANRAKGTKEDVKSLNNYLDALEYKMNEVHLHLTKNSEEITSESLKLRFLGKHIQRKTLLDIFSEHNEQMTALLGKGFKPNTLKGYKTSLKHIESYIKSSYALKDIEVRKIDYAFVSG